MPNVSPEDVVFYARIDAEHLVQDADFIEKEIDRQAKRIARQKLTIPVEVKIENAEDMARRFQNQDYKSVFRRTVADLGAGRVPKGFEDKSAQPYGPRDVLGEAFAEESKAIQQQRAIQKEADKLYAEAKRGQGAAEQAAAAVQGTELGLRKLHRQIYAIAAVAEGLNLAGSLVSVFSADSLEKRQKAVGEAQQAVRGIPIVGHPASMLGELGYRFLSASGNYAVGQGFESDQGYAERIGDEQARREPRLRFMSQRVGEVGGLNQTLRGMEHAAQVRARAGRPADEQRALATNDLVVQLNDLLKQQDPNVVRSPERAAQIERIRQAIATSAGEDARVTKFQSGQQREQLFALQARNAGDFRGARQVEFQAGLDTEEEEARRQGGEVYARFKKEIRPEKRIAEANRVRLEEEKADTESAQRVADSEAAIRDTQLRRMGDNLNADVAAYTHAQDRKIARLKEAFDQEQDLREKSRKLGELEAAGRERDAEVAAFAEQRKRQEIERTESLEGRIRVLRFRGRGQNEAAEEEQIRSGYGARIAGAGSDRERRELERERDATLQAVSGERGRRADQIKFGTAVMGWRANGFDRTADLAEIKERAREALLATNDPRERVAIKGRESVELQAFLQSGRGGRFESINAANTDVLNRFGGPADAAAAQKEAAATLKEILAELKRPDGPPRAG